MAVHVLQPTDECDDRMTQILHHERQHDLVVIGAEQLPIQGSVLGVVSLTPVGRLGDGSDEGGRDGEHDAADGRDDRQDLSRRLRLGGQHSLEVCLQVRQRRFCP